MKKIKIMVIFNLLILLFSIFLKTTYAQSKILINEFLIDPQPQQVEIMNIGNENMDISSWVIDDSGGSTFYTIPENNIIYPNTCLVFSGDFNLNKTTADTVRLIYNQEIIDSFSYKASSGSGIAYMRVPDGETNWSIGSATLGLFNQTKLSCLPIYTITPTPTIQEIIETVTPTQTTITDPNIQQPTPISISNIYISEAMVNPEAGNNEWVEFYNNNDFSVSLIDWYLDDIENYGSVPKKFSMEIPAKSYQVFNLSSSIFNNDKDSVRLLDSNKTLIDGFEYNFSTQGKTWGRITLDLEEFCIQNPSLRELNNQCLINISQSFPTTQPTQKSTIDKPILSISKINKQSIHINNITSTPIISLVNNKSQGEVLGITIKKSSFKELILIRFLSVISFTYSLLTICSILFKMKFIYEQYKKILSAFIYTSGNK